MERLLTQTVVHHGNEIKANAASTGDSFVDIICGTPCVGKTVLLRDLAKSLTQPYILCDLAIDRELLEMLLNAAKNGLVSDFLMSYYSLSERNMSNTVFLFDAMETVGEEIHSFLSSKLPKYSILATNRPDYLTCFNDSSDDSCNNSCNNSYNDSCDNSCDDSCNNSCDDSCDDSCENFCENNPDAEWSEPVRFSEATSKAKNRIRMYRLLPLNFSEFLKAVGHSDFDSMLSAHVTEQKPIPELFQSELQDCFYDFLMVGGYPQAVSAYLESRSDIAKLRYVHGQIYASILYSLVYSCSRTDISFTKLMQLMTYYSTNGINCKTAFVPSLIRKGVSKADYEAEHRYLARNGFFLSAREFRGETELQKTDNFRYEICDIGLMHYLYNDYDVFYNLEQNELPYYIYRNVLYGECEKAGISSAYWRSDRKAYIPLIIPERKQILSFICSETIKSRSENAFLDRFPDYQSNSLCDVDFMKKKANHNILWCEISHILKNKKR